jgi:beta-galactosidase
MLNNERLFLHLFLLTFSALLFINCSVSSQEIRRIEDFNKNWKFYLGVVSDGQKPELDDSQWKILNLPHDWSIGGSFSEDNPATIGGGALPGGIGWYRKVFTKSESEKNKLTFIEFDGIYRNSEVWINGNYLGKRPYGYSSFRYDLTPFLRYENEENLLAVKVDNSQQPNSRWYSGSGIYRNIRLITEEKIHIDHWGIFVTTSEVNDKLAKVKINF